MRNLLLPYSRLLLLVICCCAQFSAFSQDLAFSEDLQGGGSSSKKASNLQPLRKVLAELEVHHKVNFAFENQLIEDKMVNTQHVVFKELEKTLDVILEPLQLRYKKIGDNVYVIQPAIRSKSKHPEIIDRKIGGASNNGPINTIPVSNVVLQKLKGATRLAEVTVTGKVLDENGVGLPGVNVLVKETTTGTTTDVNGSFTLNAPDPNSTLVFSFIGYTTQEVPLNGKTTINVSMKPDVQTLSEVVVIGYGTQERTELTGSVASVNVADVKRAPVATLNEAIQGRMPGVTVSSSGLPGQTSNINIRGIGGLGAGSGPLYVVDGLWVDNIRDFNPADIESVNVLKDAATTAIYGSRGANGVVIITTRRGKTGEPAININAYAGPQNISRRWDLTNAREFAQINNMAYDNAGRPRMPGADTEFNPSIDTDWQEEVMQPGFVQDYNLGISGGGQNSNFLISGGYFNQKGTIIGPTFERYSIRLNSGMNKGRVKISQSALFTRANQVRMNGLPFIDIARMLPTIPVYDPNEPTGSGYGYGSAINNTFGTNPVALQQMQRNTGIANRFLGSITGDLTIFDFLTYRLNVGLDFNGYQDRLSREFGRWRYNEPLDPAYLTETRGDETFLLVENTLNFERQFGQHNLSAVVGYTEQKARASFARATNRTFSAVPQYYFVLSAGSTNPEVQGQDSLWAKRSYLGRVMYDYGNRYLFTASIRRDGSSRFDPTNRWGTFGAASVGWRISNEAFFEGVPYISDLKLRASYGLVGNDGLLGNYLYSAVINQNANYVLGTGQSIVLGSAQTQLASSGIQWESRYTTNIGLDMGLFNDRIFLSADYYISTTKDALVNPLIPIYLGNFGLNPYVNLGKLENKGFELALSYQQNSGAFKYGATANLTTIKNKVLALSQEGQIIPGGPHGGVTRTEVGHPVGAFYLLQMDGIFQTAEEVTQHGAQPYAKPGDVRYKDLKDDNIIDDRDRSYVGSPLPKLQYGLNLNASYANFDLTLFFQGIYGNKVWNGGRFWLDRLDDNGNYRRDLNPWTGPGTSTTTPRPLISGSLDSDNAIAASENARPNSTRWLESGSYLRLKNIQLGFNVPASLINRVKGLGSMRLYLTGQNVLTFTKYTGLDPETVGAGFFARGVDDGSFPNVRTLTFGIQAGF